MLVEGFARWFVRFGRRSWPQGLDADRKRKSLESETTADFIQGKLLVSPDYSYGVGEGGDVCWHVERVRSVLHADRAFPA